MGDERDIIDEGLNYFLKLRKRREELDKREIELVKQAKELVEKAAALEKEVYNKEHPDEALQQKLKPLEDAVAKREAQLKTMDELLLKKDARLREYEAKFRQYTVDELKAKEADRTYEFQTEKAKTGNARLDDLLMGGIMFGSNILAIGPAFIGKETLLNKFLVEGMQKGIPAIVITTDLSPIDVLDELRCITDKVDVYNEQGLLHFIDAYSKSMGMTDEMANVTYIDHPTDHKGIMDAVREVSERLRKDSEHLRVAVRSISTLITYSDPTATYKFLQMLTGKVKRSKDIAFYTMDRGMHSETDIQTLSHQMDGSIEFKTDGVKTFLAVQGLGGDVQSRAWIQYNYTKKGLNVGSFAMDHIK